MVYNLIKMFGRRFITLLITLSVVGSMLYIPVTTPKAHAFWGILDTSIDIADVVQEALDGLAQTMARTLVDRVVRSTIQWAQNGFDDNPAYVTDLEGFLVGTADTITEQFIQNKKLDALCSPFRAQIRLALRKQYLQEPQYQCTLTGVIDSFYSDFNQGGGWDTWFAMTQNDANNPYGAFLTAQSDLSQKIEKTLSIEEKQLEWNQGYLSWRDCEDYELTGFNDDGSPKNGPCEKYGPVKTPGGVIKKQLDNALSAPLEQLITADEIDELISAFAVGLLRRYVFSNDGLFQDDGKRESDSGGSENKNSREGKISIDGDLIPDGQDFDLDGQLASVSDICFHGGVTPNCIPSAQLVKSPYFEPICKAIDNIIPAYIDYLMYINTHAEDLDKGYKNKDTIVPDQIFPLDFIVTDPRQIWGPPSYSDYPGPNDTQNFKSKEDAKLWTTVVNRAYNRLNDILDVTGEYRAAYFDDFEKISNRHSYWMDNIFESLTKDSDLDCKTGLGSGGCDLKHVMYYSTHFVNYLIGVKNSTFLRCGQPTITSIFPPLPPEGYYDNDDPNAPAPGDEPPPTGGSGFGNDNSNPPPIAGDLSNVVWGDTSEVAGWAVTAGFSPVVTGGGTGMNLNYDKAGVWPVGFPLGCCTSNDELVANAWIFIFRNGSWVASTWDWMRPGQTSKDTSNLFAPENALRGGLSDFSPQSGESYGFMMSCLARNSTRNCTERSDVIMVTWP
jgi:hypothetical protein